MARVSVITPAFAAAEYLPRAVASVLAQGFGDWEMLIVSDDGEDYRACLARHGLMDDRLRFLASPVYGSGPHVARNMGLAAARGEFIALLDADDVYYPERLARLVALAVDHGMAGDNLHVVEARGGRRLQTVFPRDPKVQSLGLEDFCRCSVPLLFVFHRSVAGAGWDEDVGFGEDTLFNLRALEQAGQAVIDAEPLHEYRVHPASICHGPDAVARAEVAYRYCLQRLREDGLGFRTPPFRAAVTALLHRKRVLNRAYRRALQRGFAGSFQHYLVTHQGIET